jgi:hypothetical protein
MLCKDLSFLAFFDFQFIATFLWGPRLTTRVRPTTLQATDRETILIRTGVIVTTIALLEVISIVWQS